jgi:lipoate-protein ligase A
MTRSTLLQHAGADSAIRHLAFDHSWLGLRADRQRPDLLRFYRTQPYASVGRFQAIDRELRLEYCADQGIAVARRITGGGALYHDPQQMGFTLVLGDADGCLASHLHAACTAIISALSEFGLEAGFKFPNDVEIEGRKIASVFAVVEHGVLLLHGILLLDVDIRAMLEALRVPTEKLSPDGLAAARDRFAPFSERCPNVPERALQQALETQLARTFALTLQSASHDETALTEAAAPSALPAHAIDWRGQDGNWLEALWKTPAGVLLRGRATFTPEGKVGRIEFAADCQTADAAFLDTLQQALCGIPEAHLEEAIHRNIGEDTGNTPGVSKEDFSALAKILLDKHHSCQSLGLSRQQASRLMIHSPGKAAAENILERASVMLVPYCAKPAWCEWRHQDDCIECGLCEVGEAYRLSRERGMAVKTIVRYEHLVETLREIKAEGASAYVGMCCSHFFIKRHRAFSEAGMDALLMDIDGANCYELKQEHQAYAGTFQAEALLDEPLLQSIMEFVPGPGNIGKARKPERP